MHPIDEAIQQMAERKQRRTWPLLSLAELAELNNHELRQIALAKKVNARQRRATMIATLYLREANLERRVGR
ncbi:MAG: hypothetical protein KJ063_02440 [Anaerolineae bacterium]|nr:hypothetical protein [Anaerolineae bacterium]